MPKNRDGKPQRVGVTPRKLTKQEPRAQRNVVHKKFENQKLIKDTEQSVMNQQRAEESDAESEDEGNLESPTGQHSKGKSSMEKEVITGSKRASLQVGKPSR
jgi:hypothetical protein